MTQIEKNEMIARVFKYLQERINLTSKEHGFNEDWDAATTDAQRNLINGTKIALIHSELSEALEAVRKNIGADDHISEFLGVEAELADAVIRILHFAEQNQLRLAEAVLAKMEYNDARPFKHGGKAF